MNIVVLMINGINFSKMNYVRIFILMCLCERLLELIDIGIDVADVDIVIR